MTGLESIRPFTYIGKSNDSSGRDAVVENSFVIQGTCVVGIFPRSPPERCGVLHFIHGIKRGKNLIDMFYPPLPKSPSHNFVPLSLFGKPRRSERMTQNVISLPLSAEQIDLVQKALEVLEQQLAGLISPVGGSAA